MRNKIVLDKKIYLEKRRRNFIWQQMLKVCFT